MAATTDMDQPKRPVKETKMVKDVMAALDNKTGPFLQSELTEMMLKVRDKLKMSSSLRGAIDFIHWKAFVYDTGKSWSILPGIGTIPTANPTETISLDAAEKSLFDLIDEVKYRTKLKHLVEDGIITDTAISLGRMAVDASAHFEPLRATGTCSHWLHGSQLDRYSAMERLMVWTLEFQAEDSVMPHAMNWDTLLRVPLTGQLMLVLGGNWTRTLLDMFATLAAAEFMLPEVRKDALKFANELFPRNLPSLLPPYAMRLATQGGDRDRAFAARITSSFKLTLRSELLFDPIRVALQRIENGYDTVPLFKAPDRELEHAFQRIVHRAFTLLKDAYWAAIDKLDAPVSRHDDGGHSQITDAVHLQTVQMAEAHCQAAEVCTCHIVAAIVHIIDFVQPFSIPERAASHLLAYLEPASSLQELLAMLRSWAQQVFKRPLMVNAIFTSFDDLLEWLESRYAPGPSPMVAPLPTLEETSRMVN